MNAPSQIRLIIVEDNPYMREGWKTLLNLEQDMKVVATFSSCEELYTSKQLNEIDVALMDIKLPGVSGVEGVRWLKLHYPNIQCIMATVFDDDANIFQSLAEGAIGYMLKKSSPDELIHAVRDAVTGGSPMTPEIARRVITSMQKPSKSSAQNQLNERETEILKGLAEGKSYQTIANEIFLSTDGVRYHIRNIYYKLQVNTRSEAVLQGVKKNLI